MRAALLARVTSPTEGGLDPQLVDALCKQMRSLARHEDERAAIEASGIANGLSCPPSVMTRRVAARVLRACALRLEAEVRDQLAVS